MAFQCLLLAWLSSFAQASPADLGCGDPRFAVGNKQACMGLSIKDRQHDAGLKFEADQKKYVLGTSLNLSVTVSAPYDNSTGADPEGIYFAILSQALGDNGTFTSLPATVALKDKDVCTHQAHATVDDSLRQDLVVTWSPGSDTCGDVRFTLLWGNGAADIMEGAFLHRTTITVAGNACSQVCSVCSHEYDAEQDGHGMAFEDLPDTFKCPMCGAARSAFEAHAGTTTTTTAWVCDVCTHVYDPEKDPQTIGLDAGLPFEDLPDNFKCPVCGADKSAFKNHAGTTTTTTAGAGEWVCTVCSHVYDPEKDPVTIGLDAGLPFEDLPDTFKCPVCGAAKSAFVGQKSNTYSALMWIHRCGVLLSWGFLFPLGVSLVRFHMSGARLKLHRYIQCLGLLVEVIQFSCIVTAHQIGPAGQGPVDGNFAGSQGAAPNRYHKQIGLVLFICVLLQLVLGIMRPKPYPNGLLRRVWIWAHRAIGDGSLMLAWVQIWQAIVTMFAADRNVCLGLGITMGLFMACSAVVTPLYLIAISSIKAQEHDEEEGLSRSMLSQVQPEGTDHVQEAMFHGCGHCTQVFTSQAVLETHIKYIHPGHEYKEVVSPMPKRFAEVSNLPGLNEGIPLSEVASHNVKDDCWVVIHGKVYDLTAFLALHPGGPNTILSWAGRDATKTWRLIHQPSWINRYKDTAICKGPVAPEEPGQLRQRQEKGSHAIAEFSKGGD